MIWPFNKFFGDPEPGTDVRAASPENPSTSLANPEQWLIDWATGGASYAGPHVNEQNSMRASAVFACVSLLSGLVGGLPLKLYARTREGREEASGTRLWKLLHDQPNERMTSFTWREIAMVHLLQWGNHYSIIRWDNAGRVVALEPVEPWKVDPRRAGTRLRYRLTLDTGTFDLDQDDMIHVPGVGFDGVRGISRIAAAAKQSIGTSLALEESTARLHANSARPSGLVEVPPNISEASFKRLRAEFAQLNTGVQNAGRVVFADQGSKFQPMMISPLDAQAIEQRRFQVTDIARIYGVPPHMIGETDKATSWGSGIEQMTLSFLRFTLEKDLKRIEDELTRKLCFGSPLYAEFDRAALLAMDAKTQAETFASAIQNGYMNINEIRRLQNRPGVGPAGDRHFIQSNLMPIDAAPAPGEKPPAATPDSDAA